MKVELRAKVYVVHGNTLYIYGRVEQEYLSIYLLQFESKLESKSVS